MLIGREAGRDEADLLEALAIIVVYLIAMAMALGNRVLAIERHRERARLDVARPRAEPHRAAHLRDVLLRIHDVDDLVGRVGIDLGRFALGNPSRLRAASITIMWRP